jgi:hypothetical protein
MLSDKLTSNIVYKDNDVSLLDLFDRTETFILIKTRSIDKLHLVDDFVDVNVLLEDGYFFCCLVVIVVLLKG